MGSIWNAQCSWAGNKYRVSLSGDNSVNSSETQFSHCMHSFTGCSDSTTLAASSSVSQLNIGGGAMTSTAAGGSSSINPWLCLFTSASNRHALPLFTSLLNTVCGYDPVGRGLPYNHLLFHDSRESLVEVALQIIITALDSQDGGWEDDATAVPDNLFINYLSRIHRDEDFSFVLRGFTRLLNNPLHQTYLPHSTKKVNFHQELLVFFWKFCDYNKKFLFYVLKCSEVLEILVPILFHLNDARGDQSRVGLLHIGVFILLLLSGERNFGVRLNKPYTAAVPMDIPVFTGSHADLMIIVFHKIITTGHQRLQPLFDCLLTILVNVSPYIKSLSMVASNKLLHLLEAFCTPWFLFSAPHHHHLVFFLLETFNNIIQYQFDGNSNLVYTLIRKRQVFHSLANLPTDMSAINKTLNSRKSGLMMGKKWTASTSGVGGGNSGGLKITSPVVAGNLKAVENRENRADDTGGKQTDSGSTLTNKIAEINGDLPSGGGGVFGDNVDSGSEGLDSTKRDADGGSKSVMEALAGTQTVTLAALPRLDKMTEQESAHPTSRQLKELTAAAAAANHSPSTDLITAMSPVADSSTGMEFPSTTGGDASFTSNSANASSESNNNTSINTTNYADSKNNSNIPAAVDIAASFAKLSTSSSTDNNNTGLTGTKNPSGTADREEVLGVGSASDLKQQLQQSGNRLSTPGESGGVAYPPSPHTSTKIQPPSNPHHTIAYQQLRQQSKKMVRLDFKPVILNI